MRYGIMKRSKRKDRAVKRRVCAMILFDPAHNPVAQIVLYRGRSSDLFRFNAFPFYKKQWQRMLTPFYSLYVRE
ncbi:MAG: hypothetical protein H6Q13_46 [Bacteroidetes bacterium]|nr:hypothetical protein [Bacteroidota bacterium]